MAQVCYQSAEVPLDLSSPTLSDRSPSDDPLVPSWPVAVNTLDCIPGRSVSLPPRRETLTSSDADFLQIHRMDTFQSSVLDLTNARVSLSGISNKKRFYSPMRGHHDSSAEADSTPTPPKRACTGHYNNQIPNVIDDVYSSEPLTPDPEPSSSSSTSPTPVHRDIALRDLEFKTGRNIEEWIGKFKDMSREEKKIALDVLLGYCSSAELIQLFTNLEPHARRDIITDLPKELSIKILSYLSPSDLARASQTCRYWRILGEDNLLWRDICVETCAPEYNMHSRRRRLNYVGFDGIERSPYKVTFLTSHTTLMNWRHGRTRSTQVCHGHDDHVITCLEYSNKEDEEVVISGSDDCTLNVWDCNTGKLLRTLCGHTGGVWCSQLQGSTLVSGSTDRSIRIWNWKTGDCTSILHGHTSTVRCLCLYGKSLVSGSRDATIRVWDMETRKSRTVLYGHTGAVRCVKFDGRRIVSGGYDFTVRIWEPDNPDPLFTLFGHTNRVYSIEFNGQIVVSGSLDATIRVWDVQTGMARHVLYGHQSLTSALQIVDNFLVSGNADATIRIWDLHNGECVRALVGDSHGTQKHRSAVTSIQIVRDFVISSSDDGSVKLWNFHTGDFIRDLLVLEERGLPGSGGVIWRVKADFTRLICAAGSRNETERTKVVILDFDLADETAEVNAQTAQQQTPKRRPLPAVPSKKLCHSCAKPQPAKPVTKNTMSKR